MCKSDFQTSIKLQIGGFQGNRLKGTNRVPNMKNSLSGKEKAHKHELFAPVSFGTAPGVSQGQTSKGRRKSLCGKRLCAFFARYIRKRGRVQKSMANKVPWNIGMLIYLLQLRNHSFSCGKQQLHLPVTLRPPIWQLAFWIFISL